MHQLFTVVNDKHPTALQATQHVCHDKPDSTASAISAVFSFAACAMLPIVPGTYCRGMMLSDQRAPLASSKTCVFSMQFLQGRADLSDV